MSKNLLVTSSNAAYFPLVQDLILSIRTKTFATAFDIALLDTGLTDEQKIWLESASVRVVPAERHAKHPNIDKLEALNPAFRTLVEQLFIPDYFPDAENFVWIDGDMWVQTTEAIDCAFAATQGSEAMALVPEFDRCYPPFFESAEIWEIYRIWYSANFDEATTAAMLFKPMFNVGFWGLARSSRLWGLWRSAYQNVLENLKDAAPSNFMVHQLVLNVLLTRDKVPHVILPATFNWLTAFALPMLDPKTALYVENQPPYRPISQLHLTRPNKAQAEDIALVGGGKITTPLMFRARPKLKA